MATYQELSKKYCELMKETTINFIMENKNNLNLESAESLFSFFTHDSETWKVDILPKIEEHFPVRNEDIIIKDFYDKSDDEKEKMILCIAIHAFANKLSIVVYPKGMNMIIIQEPSEYFMYLKKSFIIDSTQFSNINGLISHLKGVIEQQSLE